MDAYNRPEPFQYSPLNKAEGDIRLIQLVPGNTESISCQIKRFSWKECPKYTALSYMWGDPARIHPIEANGQKLLVTKSLEIFLMEIRSRCSESTETDTWAHGWFWIDAVCINQDDLVERNNQVTRMKDIYDESYSVVSLTYSQVFFIFNCVPCKEICLYSVSRVLFKLMGVSLEPSGC